MGEKGREREGEGGRGQKGLLEKQESWRMEEDGAINIGVFS
jgi:hypothetical protein